MRDHQRLRLLALVLTVLYGAVVAVIAFWPVPVDSPELRRFIITVTAKLSARLPGPDFGYPEVESLANVALFVPFGLLCGILAPARQWWAAVTLGLVASGLIETGQWLFLNSRFATVEDVAANTVGAAIGVAGSAVIHAARRRSAGRRRERGYVGIDVLVLDQERPSPR